MIGVAFGGMLGFLAPTFWLRQQTKVHLLALDRDSLMRSISGHLRRGWTHAGCGHAARRPASLSLAHPKLSRELEITHLKRDLVSPALISLKNLGERTGSDHWKAWRPLLVQADRFWHSVASALSRAR